MDDYINLTAGRCVCHKTQKRQLPDGSYLFMKGIFCAIAPPPSDPHDYDEADLVIDPAQDTISDTKWSNY